MVRTQRSSLEFLHLEQRPDAGRIAGISAAIAIHVIVLMVLLAPMAAPKQVVLVDERIRTPPDLPRKEPPPPPPLLTPVVNPPVTPPQTNVQPPPLINAPPVNNEIIVENGTVAAIPTVPSNEIIDPGPSMSEPLAGAHLQYANAPPPVYPRAALRDRLTGTVTLQVLVDIDGRPLEASIAQSSGHRELDRAAVDHVLKRWSFRPAMKNGQPVQAIGLVPIAFNLR